MKEKIAAKILEFLAQYAPLSKAQVATLGGRGVESVVWRKKRIPSNHGWIIERSKSKSGTIIDIGYRFVNQLKGFPVILDGLPPYSNSLDCFHFDVSGTLSNDRSAELALVLPYILRSQGKCLAITVADGRRNPILDRWREYSYRARRMIGPDWKKFLDQIVADQRALLPMRSGGFIKPFDILKAAKRELGFLLDLTKVLSSVDQGVSFDRIERYAYVSRYAGSPFRMRTYIFHLANIQSTVRDLVDLWVRSKLLSNNEEYELIEIARTHGGNMTLDELISALGEPLKAEYADLKSKADRLDQLSALLGTSQPSRPTVSPKENQPKQVGRKHKKTWHDLTVCDQVEWVITTLEKKASAGSAWNNLAQWEKWIKSSFGYYEAKLGKSLRSAMARSGGKFRDNFLARIRKNCGDKAQHYIERLNRVAPQ